jgi:hypothetical protein
MNTSPSWGLKCEARLSRVHEDCSVVAHIALVKVIVKSAGADVSERSGDEYLTRNREAEVEPRTICVHVEGIGRDLVICHVVVDEGDPRVFIDTDLLRLHTRARQR